MVHRYEKGHDFDLDTGACTKCGMTINEYKDHGGPPCPSNKGERSESSVEQGQRKIG
jgi:hypothetical protein